jgi:hypothetical protein
MRKRPRSYQTSPDYLTRRVLRAGDPVGQPTKLRLTSGSQAPPEETRQTKLPVLVRYSRLCFPGFLTRSVDRGMHPSTQNTPVETCHPLTYIILPSGESRCQETLGSVFDWKNNDGLSYKIRTNLNGKGGTGC